MTPAERSLRRLLVNGPLAAWPSRPADHKLLVEMAATRFAAGRVYSEREVNDVLSNWLATFASPFGIDHATMRRELVDARFLVRTRDGAAYELAARGAAHDDALREVDPARILAAIGAEREARKRGHAGG